MLTRQRLQQLLDQGWKVQAVSAADEEEHWALLEDETGDTLRFPVNEEAWLLAAQSLRPDG